jgi:hypothetical protein
MELRRILLVGTLALPLSAMAGAGCANLEVKKIPVAERSAGADLHENGFRYYLTRPYVVVNAKVKVCEHQTAVVVGQGKPVEMIFLDGPRRGQTVALDRLTVTDPGSGAARAVTPEELSALRAAVSNQAGGADANVVPVAAAAPAGGAPSNGSSPTVPTAPTAAKGQQYVPDSDIQIVFLPDLDEQYAIKSCNFVSKTAFNLSFGEGSTLDTVAANHDSTPVALELLRTVDSVIDAAKSLAGSQSQSDTTGGTPKAAKLVLGDANNESYLLIETTYLKPGVYRLNKPWEKDCGPQATGCGLLAKMGLPTVTEVQLQKVKTK